MWLRYVLAAFTKQAGDYYNGKHHSTFVCNNLSRVCMPPFASVLTVGVQLAYLQMN